MYFENWDIVECPEPGYSGSVLLRNKKDRSKGTVVFLCYDADQLRSAMPGDLPSGGGTWFAGVSDYGISYVASVYSYGYARRKYREMVDLTNEEHAWREYNDRLIALESED
jgi:hypothetical protein